MPALILLAGCATPKPPVEYKDVPGPSTNRAVLPPVSAPATAPAHPPVEKQKPAPAQQQKPARTQKRKPATPPPKGIVTPDSSLRGNVSRYNEAGRFVVLEFPIAHLPVVGQKLFVYRNGLKMGELKVTGPQRDDRTVADLTAGEAQAGDEVRDQ